MKTILLLVSFLSFTSSFSQNEFEVNQETIDKIDAFVKSKKDYYNSPSIAVAITDNTNTFYLKHFGNVKTGDKYLIGSNTKSFTALLILLLQEEGKLNINEPVRKYLSWFKYGNSNISEKITIKDLLQHTSGISTKLGETFLENDSSFDYTNYYTKELGQLHLNELPKQPYRYSNANYRILGLLIEKVTGKSFEECVAEYITKPMSLANTSASLTPDLIDSYQYFLYYPVLKFSRSFHRQEIPSGLISSSAKDMAVYLRNLMNSYNDSTNTVVDSNIAKQLFTPNLENRSSYGLGWRIVNDIFYHSGTNKSFESSMYILPKINKAIVVLINSNQAPDGEIIDGIASILLNQKSFNISIFPYYRSLPFVVLFIFILFLIQFFKWKKLKFPLELSRKILPNILVLLGLAICIAFILIFPMLNGVSLTTAIQFDPTSGYSIIIIALLLGMTFILKYLSKKSA